MPTTASHWGTASSSERRSIRKNSTMTTARSTMAMSSWVMPEVMCPNPLNRLNGWVRWNTTAMPPTTSTTAEQMSAGSCTAPPRFCSARMPLGAEDARGPGQKAREDDERDLNFHGLLDPLPLDVAHDVEHARSVAHVGELVHLILGEVVHEVAQPLAARALEGLDTLLGIAVPAGPCRSTGSRTGALALSRALLAQRALLHDALLLVEVAHAVGAAHDAELQPMHFDLSI